MYNAYNYEYSMYYIAHSKYVCVYLHVMCVCMYGYAHLYVNDIEKQCKST